MNCRNYVIFTTVFYYIGDEWWLLWWWWYNNNEPFLSYPSAKSVKIVFHNAHLAHKHTYVYVDLKKYGITISAWRLWELRIFLTVHSRPWPPHSWGFYITNNDASQSVGLLWTSDQPVTETSNNTQHNKHPCPCGIRTLNLSRGSAADLHLRPHGHWDRQNEVLSGC